MSHLEDQFDLMLRALSPMTPTPEKEYRFYARRKWRFDRAWPGKMVAVEIEGGVYSGGRHTRGKGFEDDCEKYNMAASLGWCVIRITAGMMDRQPQQIVDMVNFCLRRCLNGLQLRNVRIETAR